MRLALFTDSNVFYADGVGRIIRELMAYIRGRPIHRMIVFHRGNGPGRAEPFSENVIVYNIATPVLHVPTYDAYPFFYLSSPRRRLLEITRGFHPDIVLTVTPYIPLGIGRSALYVSERLGVPLVGSFDVHIGMVSEHYARKLLRASWAIQLWLRYASLMMRGYEKCTRILVPSGFVWEHVKERYGVGKCVIFPRGVDGERFSPIFKEESFKVRHGIGGKTAILYVGRLSLEKNLETLLTIYAKLKAIHNDVALMIVGEGPQRKQLDDWGLPDLVLTGVLRGAELSRAYASADIFAFPSLVDAGPMVILEAMASGLPVVVFNQGGAPDGVIHGETGFVARDVPDFAACLDKLIQDIQLRLAMGTNARKHAERHRWERIFDQVLAIFDNVRKR